jgi:hypothetical protein
METKPFTHFVQEVEELQERQLMVQEKQALSG